jgi:hypothetical protein
MTILYFFLFLWVIFALLDPDPDPATQINADPCGSGYGSETLTKTVCTVTSVADLDQHHFEKPDLDPHQSEKPNPDPHQRDAYLQ